MRDASRSRSVFLLAMLAAWIVGCTVSREPEATARLPRRVGERPETTTRASRLPDLGRHAVEVRAAVDATGRALLAWVESRAPLTGEVRIGTQRADGTWVTEAASAALAGRAEAPRIAAGRDGSVIVCWRQIVADAPRVYVSRRESNGRWTHPSPGEALSFPPNAYEPEVAIGSDGEVLLVWNQATSTGLGVGLARREPGGSRFVRPGSPDSVLSPAVQFSNSPEVAVNALGEAVVSWYQSTGDALNVFVSERRRGETTFSRPDAGAHLSFDDRRPEGAHDRFLGESVPAIDDGGNAAVAWAQPVDADVVALYLATRSSSGPWRAPQGLQDAFFAAAGQSSSPRLAAGRAGELWVVWKHTETARSTIRLAHRDATGWRIPGHRPWTLSTEGAQVGPPTIAAHRGAAVVAWSETSGGSGRVLGVSGRVDDRPHVLVEAADAAFHSVSAAIGGPNGRGVVAWIGEGRVGAASFDRNVDR